MWALWITLIIGIWFIISGLFPTLIANWNFIIFGIAAIIFGFTAFFSNKKLWQGLINGIIGIWMLLNGIWIALTGSWNFIVFGIVLLILSIWGAMSPAGKTTA